MSQYRYSNAQLAEIFTRIADLLEIKGEVIYKILAYRKAADSLENYSLDVNELWQDGKLQEIPGVGKAIAEKIDELLSTGNLEFLKKLENEVPPGLVEILDVPDLGPKKVALFWKELGITNLQELETAARSGKLQDLKGMGTKSEEKVLAGIESLARRTDRIPLGQALPFAENLKEYLRAQEGVEAIETAGSLRRMRETVGDLDLIASSTAPEAIMSAFISHPQVVEIVGKGEIKSSVVFGNGVRVQLWVQPPERYGTALQYGTGSKDHNVRLREIAIKNGYSLSDQALTDQQGREILFANEGDLYKFLGMSFIPPELREDRGEIQAALKGELPNLIKTGDITAELHSHSTWSDGKLSIRDMALAAIERGRSILAITDHSGSLGVAGGLSIEEVQSQKEELDQLKNELGEQILLLRGCEVEIRADGTLDYPDDILVTFDLVIASLHTGLRQSREQVTGRMLSAINNPHVDIIAHPTGRMIPNREGADLDISAIFKAALENDVALEINSYPSRLDLNDVLARRAVEMGIKITINTDAHSATDMDLLYFGIATARRAWIEPHQVINTWSEERLLQWLQARGK